jgi:ubiquinone biosynthesis protein Coq4
MTVEMTNNPTAAETDGNQEPQGGLESTEETTVEGTGTTQEQPETDSGVEEESQVKGVDLNKAISRLSKAEQKAYKAFQAEFTKSKQKLSDYELFEQQVNSMLSDPEVSALLKAKSEKAKAEKQPDLSKMSEEEIFNYTVDKRVEEKLSALEQKMEAKYGSFINESLVKQGNQLINDFAQSKGLEVDAVRELAKYAVGHRVSLDEAYKVAYFDKIPEQAKQDALKDLEIKKNANLELGNVPTGATPVSPQKPTIKEALDMARKETGITKL